jgi:hypothetical protein
MLDVCANSLFGDVERPRIGLEKPLQVLERLPCPLKRAVALTLVVPLETAPEIAQRHAIGVGDQPTAFAVTDPLAKQPERLRLARGMARFAVPMPARAVVKPPDARLDPAVLRPVHAALASHRASLVSDRHAAPT